MCSVGPQGIIGITGSPGPIGPIGPPGPSFINYYVSTQIIVKDSGQTHFILPAPLDRPTTPIHNSSIYVTQQRGAAQAVNFQWPVVEIKDDELIWKSSEPLQKEDRLLVMYSFRNDSVDSLQSILNRHKKQLKNL